MANDYNALKKLLADPVLIATVQAVNGDGSITAETPQHNTVRLKGTASVNKMVLYQGNQILTQLDPLPIIQVSITS